MSINGFLTTDGVQKYDWEALDNKPFGEAIETTIAYDETRPVNENIGMYQHDPIDSIYSLLGSTLKVAATDTDGVTTYTSWPIYPEIITSVGMLGNVTEEYFLVLDAGVQEPSLAGLVYMLVDYNSSIGMCYIVTQEVTLEGFTLAPGVYLPPKATLDDGTTIWIESISFAEYSKIDKKFLPDDIGSSGSGAYLFDLTSAGVGIDGSAVVLQEINTFNGLKAAVAENMPIVVRGCTTIDGNLDETPVSFVASATDLAAADGDVAEMSTLGIIHLTGVIVKAIDGVARVLRVQVDVCDCYGAFTYISTAIDDVAGCGTSPASNVKYIDFGSGDIDTSSIDYSQYTAGDLILLVEG